MLKKNLPKTATHLEELDGFLYRGIVADPAWPYTNTASRGAAENHYPTMSIEDICNEPVENLAADDAHLHLWTTNAFLEPAFEVIRAWGFTYKSCMVWVKPTIGMGNYWRVSHEFLLFAVRGNLPFQCKDKRSWVLHPRESHSRKPFIFRSLIEQVTPGPYLEMYGREEQHSGEWTVYGNNVERRLF